MVTIIDVANYAGVSKTTVSTVLNNGPHVKPETRKRVEEAVQALGYVCNNNARGLRKKETRCLGVIIAIESKKIQTYEYHYETGQFSYGVSNGIVDGLIGTDYGLLTERYCPSESNGELPQLIKNARVDGVILVGGLFTYDILQKIHQTGVPAVGVGRFFESIDCVFADVVHAMYLQTRELLQTGHRHLALINCPRSYVSSQDRLLGWNQALGEYNRESLETWQTYCPTNTGEGGYLAMKQLWEQGVRPDGIVTANEPIALGAMRFLYEKGVRIPEDISITSYEASVLGGYSSPPLTSINIHKEQMGGIAAQMLLNRIENPDTPVAQHIIEPELLIRASVVKK